MKDDLPTESIKLWRADAIVLFDWLTTTDLNEVPISHPAQKQALVDLLNRFEQGTHVTEVTQLEIGAAQAEVVCDMGC